MFKKIFTLIFAVLAASTGHAQDANLLAGWDGGESTDLPTTFGWTSSKSSTSWGKLNASSGERFVTSYSSYTSEDGSTYSYDGTSALSTKLLYLHFSASQTYTYSFTGLQPGHAYRFTGLVAWHNNDDTNKGKCTVSIRSVDDAEYMSAYTEAQTKKRLYPVHSTFIVPADETATKFKMVVANGKATSMLAISAVGLYDLGEVPFQSWDDDSGLQFGGGAKESGVYTYIRDRKGDLSFNAQACDVPGWYYSTGASDGTAAAVTAYGSGVWVGGNSDAYTAPASGPDELSNGYALGLVAVWGGSVGYVKPMEITAGNYTLTFHVYNSAGTGAISHNNCGFIELDGTEHMALTTKYSVGAWTAETVTLSLDKATRGYLSVGYKAGDYGSGSAPHLFVDRIVVAERQEPPLIADAMTGYLFTEVDGERRFLARGKDDSYGTRAVLADRGLPVMIYATDDNDETSIRWLDSQLFLFANSGNEVYTDASSSRKWSVAVAGEQMYTFSAGDDAYIGQDTHHWLVSSCAASDALVWQFMTKAQYDAYISSKLAARRAEILTAAGVTEEQLAAAIIKEHIGSSATDTKTIAQIYDKTGSRTWNLQTKPGLYVLNINALMRSGSTENVRQQLGYGFDEHMSTLTANGTTLRIKSLWDGRQTASIPKGSSTSITVDGEKSYVPTNQDAAGYVFDNTAAYANSLLALVGDDGILDITLESPYKVSEAWLSYRDLTVSRVILNFAQYKDYALDEIADYAARNTTSDAAFAAALATARAAVESAVDIETVDAGMVDVRNAYTAYSYAISDWSHVNLGQVNLENDQVRAFLAAADYRQQGAASVIDDYANGIADQPAPVNIPILESYDPRSSLTLYVSNTPDYSGTDEHTRTLELDPALTLCPLYNTTPGITYYYKVLSGDDEVTAGTFTATGVVRMIATQKGSNVRDLGGRITMDGRRVRYGRLFRGGEMHAGTHTTMTTADLAEMARLGLEAELDLRSTNDTNGSAPSRSAISGADYKFIDLIESSEKIITKTGNPEKVRDGIHFIAECMKADKPVYFHCIWGADRTGAFGLFLGSILGFTLDDLCKDFELTSFSKAGKRYINGTSTYKYPMMDKIVYAQEHYEGRTLQERIVALLKDVGVTDDDIMAIRSYMLEDDAEALATRYEQQKAYYQQVISLAGAQWNTTAADATHDLTALAEAYDLAMNAVAHEVDLTSLLVNPDFNNGISGWIDRGSVSFDAVDGNRCPDIYEAAASVRQSLNDMPSGTYTLKLQAFQRIGGTPEEAYSAYLDGQGQTTSYIMINNHRQTVHNINEDAQNEAVRSSDANLAPGTYVPDSHKGAIQYFDPQRRLYWNTLDATLGQPQCLTIGLTHTGTGTQEWTAFDNARLYYRGAACTEQPTLTLNDAADITLPQTDQLMIIDPQSNRTLKANCWNTVCLPFNINEAMAAQAGITHIYSLTGFANGAQTALFMPVNEMKAGRPYLVRVNDDWNVSQAGTVVVRAKQPVAIVTDAGSMQGFYNPQRGVSNLYFVTGNDQVGNSFAYAEQPVNLRGLRATISLVDTPAGVKSMTINEDSLTNIDATDKGCIDRMNDGEWYDLGGRRIIKGKMNNGLYITKGKKMIIK